MIKDFNQTKSVQNQCFRNTSAYDSDGKLRDPVVIWEGGDPLAVLIHQTPTTNTRQIIVGINLTSIAEVTFRKYFSAGAGFVDEVFPAVPAGNSVLESNDALDSVEILFGNNPLALRVDAFATVIARP